MVVEKVTRRGRKSIVREVSESLRAIDKIGESKRAARRAGDTGIHSTKQMSNTMSDAQNFAKWVRDEYKILSLNDVKQEHYKSYVSHLQSKGVSNGHIRNIETSLRLLEKGVQKHSERPNSHLKCSEGFCPEKRLVTYQRNENAQNRAYSPSEMMQIRMHCSPEVQKSVDLMQNLGLRVRESVYVRVEHFVRDQGVWYLNIENGAGITKGGRHRKIPVPREFELRLERLLQNKSPEQRVVAVASTTVRDGVNAACKKASIEQNNRGTHGFRHSYARSRMEQLSTPAHQQMMARILENCESDRKADYGILKMEDKQLYQETKEVMDKIHGELGHGKDRWELAVRYLKT